VKQTIGILTEAILKLRLAPPSERYQRIARRGEALSFATDLREACPNVGARVYLGGGGSASGYVVTLADDNAAAHAAGVGRMTAYFPPERR
jgi:hypothetical protein